MTSNHLWKKTALATLLATTTFLTGCDDDDAPAAAAPSTNNPSTPAPATLLSGPNNPTVLGLTEGGELVSFKADTPDTATGQLRLTGQIIDNSASPPFPVGMDYRPADGRLYVLFNDNRLYTVNLTSGALTLVKLVEFPAGASVRSIDFNPLPDLIRAVSAGGDEGNFRVRPTDGTLAGTDSPMAYANGDANAGSTPAISGVAYTGAPGASATTLFGLDSTRDVLVTVGSANGSPNSPNTGLLQTVAPLSIPIGGDGAVGFDIPTSGSNVGFLTDISNNQTSFYRINLTTGAMTRIGSVGSQRLVGIALVPGTGTGAAPPSPPTTTTPTGGTIAGDTLCPRLIGGTGTPVPTVENACFLVPPAGVPAPASGCSVDNPGNIVDADVANAATVNLNLGVLGGTPLEDVILVTVRAAPGATFAAGSNVGAVFSLVNPQALQATLLPTVTVTTFNGDTQVQTQAFDSSDLILGINTLLPAPTDRFFLGMPATGAYNSVQIGFSGVVGLLTSLNIYGACPGTTTASGTIPNGLALPAPPTP